MNIQRYDINPPSLVEEGYPETTPNNYDGQIVYYTDHAAEVERLMVERDSAVARAERAEEALRQIYEGLIEINPQNHDEDDVFSQNNSVIEAIQIAHVAISESRSYELKAAISFAPDKPQYTALHPEP